MYRIKIMLKNTLRQNHDLYVKAIYPFIQMACLVLLLLFLHTVVLSALRWALLKLSLEPPMQKRVMSNCSSKAAHFTITLCSPGYCKLQMRSLSLRMCASQNILSARLKYALYFGTCNICQHLEQTFTG